MRRAVGPRLDLFDDVAAPEQEIYLSHTNALQVMAEAGGVVGAVAQMPIAQHEILLSRATGRALAHELGHYLLASKVRTERGLMKAILTAGELFSTDSNRRIEPAQRRAIAARLRGEPLVAAWVSSDRSSHPHILTSSHPHILTSLDP